MKKAYLRTETVSIGHDLAGTINQTESGFEIFDTHGKYVHTEPTILAARRALFERHKQQIGATGV